MHHCDASLPPRSDPNPFPMILAYLRDSCIPPLPESQQELQQLAAEADYFALAVLAAACRGRARAVEAEARARSLLVEQQAEAVRAACEAVDKVQAEVTALEARLAPLHALEAEVQRLRAEAEARLLDDERRLLDDEREEGERWHAALAAYHDYLARQDVDRDVMWLDKARGTLRAALLALLCALGGDLPTAEAQLRATHPHLMR